MIIFFMQDSAFLKDSALLIIRIGLGLIFVRHGYGKILGGTQTWLWLGNQMSNLGITFLPLFWGLAATCTEFFGGMFLMGGFVTRLAALLLSCVMIVAFVMHRTKGDPFSVYSHPLSLLVVFIALFFAGGGRYSIDYYLSMY